MATAAGPDLLRGPRRFKEGTRQMASTMILEQDMPIRVRYQETDAMGVLHHANYFTYFEMGRTELLRANGHNYRTIEEGGIFMVIVDVSCRYRRPARYDD